MNAAEARRLTAIKTQGAISKDSADVIAKLNAMIASQANKSAIDPTQGIRWDDSTRQSIKPLLPTLKSHFEGEGFTFKFENHSASQYDPAYTTIRIGWGE